MFFSSDPDQFLAAAGDIGYEWDLRADHIVWLGAWDKLFGLDMTPPVNAESLYRAIHPDDRPAVFGTEHDTIDRHFRLRLPNKEIVWVHERGAVDCEGGRAVRQRGLLRVLESAPSASPGATAASGEQDLLTGAHTRGQMLALLAKALEAARSSRRTAGYLVVGIDKMSFVNEAMGMEAGDALLRGVAERLRHIIPQRAELGRVAGDMFGILLPEPLGADFSKLAARVLQSFRDQPVVTSVTPLHITVSIGGVSLPAIAGTAAEAMIFAEQALHDAHQRGHNLYIEYLDSPERTQGHRMLLELGERIKHAFKHDGFRLAYQPVVDAATGQPVFYEALVRMFSDDGKPISAAQFVPAIEQLGLAFDLDRLVLDLAVKELNAWPGLHLAINISGLTAVQAEWPDHMRKVLGNCPQVAQRLIVEVTETAAIVDVSETRRFVDALRELGGQVSLDDFGAGFTAIRHLRALAVSIMKIDKELLHNLMTNAEQQHLVLVLIELARGLGIRTVAEGVETADIAEWLRRAKVDMMQGYYFGKPALDRPWKDDHGGVISHDSHETGAAHIPFAAPAPPAILI